jgi:hypothetical protein
MTYEEFEWHILRAVYEEGVTRLSPSYLGYSLGLSHDIIAHYLEQAVDAGVIEPVASNMGAIEYAVPGVANAPDLPTPIWKQQPAAPQPERPPQPVSTLQESSTPLTGEDALSSALVTNTVYKSSSPSASQGLNDPDTLGHGKRTTSPPNLRAHVRSRGDQTDGSLYNVVQARDVRIDRRMVVERGASVEETDTVSASSALVPYQNSAGVTALVPAGMQGALMNVESSGETFCDPSRTIFMRQIRVHGVKSEQALRQQIGRLFESFGYKTLRQDAERMRFERGSVGFILALVPLFVLIVPLFVYLFLYCMGRSTIHQEPLELDVKIRQNAEQDTSYDIDLTFIGLHGIVLGAADQRVLNQEIDTLSDELSWALAAS